MLAVEVVQPLHGLVVAGVVIDDAPARCASARPSSRGRRSRGSRDVVGVEAVLAGQGLGINHRTPSWCGATRRFAATAAATGPGLLRGSDGLLRFGGLSWDAPYCAASAASARAWPATRSVGLDEAFVGDRAAVVLRVVDGVVKLGSVSSSGASLSCLSTRRRAIRSR